MPPHLSIDDVLAAAERIRPHVHRTPIVTSRTFDAEVDAMVERVVSDFGRIDILFNGTGVSHNQAFLTFKEEDFDHAR